MDELYHHGIKGMKWGRRRYQNPDGTLTPDGRKRYTKETVNEAQPGEKFKMGHGKNSNRYKPTDMGDAQKVIHLRGLASAGATAAIAIGAQMYINKKYMNKQKVDYKDIGMKATAAALWAYGTNVIWDEAEYAIKGHIRG